MVPWTLAHPGFSFLAPWALVGFLVDAGLLHVLLHGEELDEGRCCRDVALGLKRDGSYHVSPGSDCGCQLLTWMEGSLGYSVAVS